MVVEGSDGACRGWWTRYWGVVVVVAVLVVAIVPWSFPAPDDAEDPPMLQNVYGSVIGEAGSGSAGCSVDAHRERFTTESFVRVTGWGSREHEYYLGRVDRVVSEHGRCVLYFQVGVPSDLGYSPTLKIDGEYVAGNLRAEHDDGSVYVDAVVIDGTVTLCGRLGDEFCPDKLGTDPTIAYLNGD